MLVACSMSLMYIICISILSGCGILDRVLDKADEIQDKVEEIDWDKVKDQITDEQKSNPNEGDTSKKVGCQWRSRVYTGGEFKWFSWGPCVIHGEYSCTIRPGYDAGYRSNIDGYRKADIDRCPDDLKLTPEMPGYVEYIMENYNGT